MAKVRAAAVALMFAVLGVRAEAQSEARNEMGVPASTIFKSMLRFAAIGETSKVDRSLDLLKPVLGEHAAAFGSASSNAVLDRIRSRKTETMVAGIRELVARDAAVLVRTVPGAPLDRARTRARTAALEWRIVEDDVRQVDGRRADAIGASFQALFDAVETRDEVETRTAAGAAEKGLLALFTK